MPLNMHLDLSSLTAMYGGDSQFMPDFITLFVETTPSNIEQIKALRKEGELAENRRNSS